MLAARYRAVARSCDRTDSVQALSLLSSVRRKEWISRPKDDGSCCRSLQRACAAPPIPSAVQDKEFASGPPSARPATTRSDLPHPLDLPFPRKPSSTNAPANSSAVG